MRTQLGMYVKIALRSLAVLLVVTTVLGLLGSLSGTGIAPATTASGAGKTTLLFLPMIRNVIPGISGDVSYQGSRAPNVTVILRFFDGSSWTPLMTMNTGSNGSFTFQGAPTLVKPQRYSVQFSSTSAPLNQLKNWTTAPLTSYTSGDFTYTSAFDIADVSLGSPLNNSTSTLPVQFQWVPRAATKSDSYELVLSDLAAGNTSSWSSGLLGFVDHFDLGALPPGFNAGDKVQWYIKVHSPDGGTGQSFGTRTTYLVP